MEELKTEHNRTMEKFKKKERKPLSKRMKNVVLSPLHLFQKYVLRKKRRSKNKKEGDKPSNYESMKSSAVEAAKRRNLPCYMLFVGLSKSGKSATISKLFNGERPNAASRTDLIKIYQNSDIGEGIGLKVVDTPGLIGDSESEDQDSQTLVALSAFLQQDIPSRVPTVTFLTAKLEKEVDPKFIQALKMISCLKRNITDQHLSNLVLLLTHSQKMEDNYSESQIAKVTEKYQNAVSNAFAGTKGSLPTIIIENFRHSKNKTSKKPIRRYHDIIFENLQKFGQMRSNHTLDEAIAWLSASSKRFSISLKKEVVPVSRYIVDDDKDYLQSLIARMSSNAINTVESQYQPYFVLFDREEADSKGPKPKNRKKVPLLTCIPAGSQIVLADRKCIRIEECIVGDKLLTLNLSNPSVITKVLQMNSVEIQDGVLGTIYCSIQRKSKTEDDKMERLVYKYENKAFALVDVMKANIPERASTKSLYFLEVDSKDGTIVVNGFPCFVQCENKM